MALSFAARAQSPVVTPLRTAPSPSILPGRSTTASPAASHGNALDLWAAVRGLPIYQAALDLCHVTHLDPPWLPTSRLIPTRRPRVPSRAPSRNR